MVVVSFPQRRFPLAALDASRVLREASAAGAQVIVLDSLAAAFLGPWLALRKPDLPLVGLLHQAPGGIEGSRLRRALQRGLDRLAYRQAALLLTASDMLRDQLIEEGVAAERIVVVRPGRDVAPIPEGATAEDLRDEEHPLRAGRRVAALCVANWLPHKGIFELLEAIARLPEQLVTLHLAGDERADPEYGPAVYERLLHDDLAGRVVPHGRLTREGVAALYAGADVFVLPSFDETYGTVYGEAMTFGLPVVGWNAGNLPHLIEHEREGMLVEPGDIDGLASALERLAGDAVLRERMGVAARERAASLPTWDETAAAFYATLREVVQRAAGSSERNRVEPAGAGL